MKTKAEQLSDNSGMLMDIAGCQAISGEDKVQVSDYSSNPHFSPSQVPKGQWPDMDCWVCAALLVILNKDWALSCGSIFSGDCCNHFEVVVTFPHF